jgi:hypothetical protein
MVFTEPAQSNLRLWSTPSPSLLRGITFMRMGENHGRRQLSMTELTCVRVDESHKPFEPSITLAEPF